MDSIDVVRKLNSSLGGYYELLQDLSKYRGTIFYTEVSNKIIQENFKFKNLICEIEHNFKEKD